ncbi:uncharacterized protein LOC135699485 [Ochlerotatus camptorhynchus]|uniref:uncharacterized protein LOC135699485 n=1 Tax=Ochlerotatus camptorhynchus TaxID=644619 RepID=UPI0031E23595
MASRKVTFKQPSASVDQLHQKIIALGENVRSHAASAKRKVEKPPMAVKFVEPEIPAPPPVVSNDLADNQYAQEIFMCKTNIRDIAREIAERRGCDQSEKVLRPFRKKLYRLYASDPKTRIREPLDMVRFESQYYEYRFFLALNKPLHSEEEYQEYREQLEAAGVAESWVSMRKHNRLLKYEGMIVKKLKRSFNKWSLKLDKLDFYLMDLHARQPRAASPTKAAAEKTTEDDQLLDNILKRSNAKNMLSEAQIRAKFLQIKHNLLAPEKAGFQWLIFDDDELNKRFQLGMQRSEAIAEIEVDEAVPQQESTVSSSRPSSVSSGDSEIAQMRSEMAMTQPQEIFPMEQSQFADTNELVRVLGTVAEPSLPEMGTLDEPQIEPMETENLNQELSPMITPAQVDVVEISDSPVKDDGLVEIKEEFIFTLDYMKNFTNMEQFVIDEINRQSSREAKLCMRKLDFYVEKYYELKKNMFLQNVLPKELRMLTRKERRERQANAAALVSDMNRSRGSSTASDALEPPTQMEISPHTETPSVPRVPRKSRLIVYAEDDEEQPNNPPVEVPEDTLPMPHSEDFLPSVYSTQLPGDSGVPPRRQDTPFQSPVKPVTPRCTSASSSRGPTPAFASHSPNATVIANSNDKSPRKIPSIKHELNSTSYEGEVEFVELSDTPIVVNDSMDATSENIPELLGRQPSCLAALPDNLRGLVNTLFRENHDTTLSQGSGTSSGSGSGRSRLSQDTANASAPSMGFHQATPLPKNAQKPS